MQRGFDGLRCLRVVSLAGFEDQLALGERQSHRGLALGNQGHTLDGLQEGVAVDDRLDRRGLGEEPSHGGVVAVHEGRRRATTGGGETDERGRARLGLAGETDLDLGARGHRLGDILEDARLDQGDLLDRGVRRLPVELAHRQAVAVGRQERDRGPVDLDANTGQEGERVVAGGSDRHLGDGLRQGRGVDRPDAGGLGREQGILVEGHDRQREVRGPAHEVDLLSVQLNGDGLGGQRLRDVREETTGDEHLTGLVNGCGNVGVSRDLVVEGGERQFVAVGLDAHASQDRRGWTHGERAGGPRNGFGQNIAGDGELHSCLQNTKRIEDYFTHMCAHTGRDTGLVGRRKDQGTWRRCAAACEKTTIIDLSIHHKGCEFCGKPPLSAQRQGNYCGVIPGLFCGLLTRGCG